MSSSAHCYPCEMAFSFTTIWVVAFVAALSLPGVLLGGGKSSESPESVVRTYAPFLLPTTGAAIVTIHGSDEVCTTTSPNSFATICTASRTAATKSHFAALRMSGFFDILCAGTWTLYSAIQSNAGSRLWFGTVDTNYIQGATEGGIVTTLSVARIIDSTCFAAIVILIWNTFCGACFRASQRAGDPQHREDPSQSGNVCTGNSVRFRAVPHSIFNFLLFLMVIVSLFRGGSAQQVRYVRVTAAATQGYFQISYLCVCNSIGTCDESNNQLSKDKAVTASSLYSGSDATQVTKGTAGTRTCCNVCQLTFFTTFLLLLAQVFLIIVMMLSNPCRD